MVYLRVHLAALEKCVTPSITVESPGVVSLPQRSSAPHLLLILASTWLLQTLIFFLIIPQFCQNFLARSFQVGFSYPRAYINYLFQEPPYKSAKPFRADVVVWEETHTTRPLGLTSLLWTSHLAFLTLHSLSAKWGSQWSHPTNLTALLRRSGFFRKWREWFLTGLLWGLNAVGAESWAPCLKHSVPGVNDIVFIAMWAKQFPFDHLKVFHSYSEPCSVGHGFCRAQQRTATFFINQSMGGLREPEGEILGVLLSLLCLSKFGCCYIHLWRPRNPLTNCLATDWYRTMGFP